MDRSYLSQPEVIQASRRFVCIRLATYEDAEEGEILTSIFVGGSGQLENTTIAVLSSDGERFLARPGRGARQMFVDAEDMAATLQRIADETRAAAPAGAQDLPKIADVRLALDIAACDGRPLVVLCATDAQSRKSLEERVRDLAWSDAFAGLFVFASVSKSEDLAAIEGVPAQAGLLVIEPDRFGQKGRVTASAPADAAPEALALALREGLRAHVPLAKVHQSHVRAGRNAGIFWETKIPVTDPHEQHARSGAR